MNPATPQPAPVWQSNKPPARIWLQWNGDQAPTKGAVIAMSEVAWCQHKIYDHDVEYVSATAQQPFREAVETILKAHRELDGTQETLLPLYRSLSALAAAKRKEQG